MSKIRSRSLLLVIVAAITTVPLAPAGPVSIGVGQAISPPPPTASWLETVNYYRGSSNLAAVGEEPSWSAGARKHIDYLANTASSLRTGQYANAHTENPASPWYSVAGADAARSSVIGTGSSDREAIDNWMRAPFHAMGILRPSLQRAGFALAGGRAVLDVIRGLGPDLGPATVMFPGPGSVTYLDSFSFESPDPREGCASDWQNFRGLPLFAMLPEDPPAGTTATLTLPTGQTVSQGTNLCVQTANTYRSSDPVYGATGTQLLNSDNAVLVLPRARLTPGVHTVTIRQPGRADVQWSFTVEPEVTATVDPQTLPSGKISVASGAPAGSAAVLANIAMVDALVPGYVTANRCSQMNDGPQSHASANHGVGKAIANLAVVPLDADGRFCLYNQVPTNLVVDVQGTFSTRGELAFDPVVIRRLVDTRTLGPIPAAGSIVRVTTGAPAGTRAALVNLAMTDATMAGYITADRCSTLAAGPQQFASGNHGAGAAIANLAVVPLDTDGSFCIYTQVPTHLVVDLQGTFSTSGALKFTPAAGAARVLDTRQLGAAPGQGAIVRVTTGAPSGTAAVLVNLAMTDASAPGYVTADRCSSLRPGPQSKASGNHGVGTAIANLGVVPLDSDGSFCIYTQVSTHLVVDLQGTFSTSGALTFTPTAPAKRVLDTRVR